MTDKNKKTIVSDNKEVRNHIKDNATVLSIGLLVLAGITVLSVAILLGIYILFEDAPLSDAILGGLVGFIGGNGSAIAVGNLLNNVYGERR